LLSQKLNHTRIEPRRKNRVRAHTQLAHLFKDGNESPQRLTVVAGQAVAGRRAHRNRTGASNHHSAFVRLQWHSSFRQHLVVGSKYCGREIRFSDALNKKIIPIFLESVQLSGVLNLILQAIQRVTLTGQNGVDEILTAIKTYMPITYDGGLKTTP
jgi:hypothetical protein